MASATSTSTHVAPSAVGSNGRYEEGGYVCRHRPVAGARCEEVACRGLRSKSGSKAQCLKDECAQALPGCTELHGKTRV